MVRLGTAVWDGWCRIGDWEVFIWADPGAWPDLQSVAFWRSVYTVRRFRPRAAFLVIPADDHPARIWRWERRLRARWIPVALAPDPSRWADPESWRRWGSWRPGGAEPPPAAGWGVDGREAAPYARIAERVLETAPETLRLLVGMGGVEGWWREEELRALLGDGVPDLIRAGCQLGLLERVGRAVRATPAGQQMLRRLLPDPAGGERRRRWGNRHPDTRHAARAAAMLQALREAGWAIQGGGRELLLADRGTYAVPDAAAIARDARGQPYLWVIETFARSPEMAVRPKILRRLARLRHLLKAAPPDLRVGIWIDGPVPLLREVASLIAPPLRWHLSDAAAAALPPDPTADRLVLPEAMRV